MVPNQSRFRGKVAVRRYTEIATVKNAIVLAQLLHVAPG